MRPYLTVILLLAGGLAGLGCEREGEIRAYKTNKEPAHVHRDRLEWVVSGEWVEWPGDEQSYAGFTLDEGKPALELVISALPREAASAADVVANVNRWQRQMGMAASSGEEVNKLVKQVVVNDDRVVSVVDLKGPSGNRTLAAMAVEADRVWFFTVKGAAERIEARKKEFEEFIASLKFHGPKDSGRESKGALSHARPAGWVEGPERPMRELTYFAGPEGAVAEVSVTKLGGTTFGDILTNINRWRGQVGLEPVGKAEDQPVEKKEIGGNLAACFDFVGPGERSTGSKLPVAQGQEPAVAQKRMLFVMMAVENDVWFFKMIGPGKTVGEEKGNFEGFVKSVEFGK
jgi:hypothetical protein